ncbi:serine/threonine protein kinase [Gallaecimonas kandeliae]|uniref:serine/threonine protein kinase n=1 Tax=Gallaecimonas kandeliae TaxID=3029055 RepID=UPI0026474D93|nr:serine/threonine protein kinase [Gallaecimonas kandeliae]WKE65618.1 serine/threonine protein kinase [Gallaecimonas kandeliae]
MPRFNFADLTPDLILDALEELDIRVSSGLLPLNSFENRVYQFLDDDRRRWVVKFYRPERWTDAQIQEEHDFALELAAAELPVVAPERLQGRTLHHGQGYRLALYSSVGGRPVEIADLDTLDTLGQYLGRLHRLGAGRDFQYREKLDPELLLGRAGAAIAACELVPDYLQQPLKAILAPLVDTTLEAFARIKAQSIRLHGDCHAGNFLEGPNGLFVLDLDDARQGPAMQDLWMLLSGDRHEREAQLAVLVEAYEQFMDFDPAQLRLVAPLQALRQVQHLGWLAERWGDPAFPRAFPWLAEPRHWENQILNFKESLAALAEPPLRLLTGY